MGSEGLFAFDMNGNQKWRADLGVMDVGLVDDPGMQWGPASSPVIFGDMVHGAERPAQGLVPRRLRPRDRQGDLADGARGLSVLGDAGGHPRRTDAPRSSPTRASTSAASIPQTGKELWRLSDNRTQVKVPTPIAAGDLVIVTGGYPPGGRPIYAIRPGGSGELTEKALAWKTDRGAPYTGTPIMYNGLLYALTDNGILSAYEPKTGERIYQQRVAGGSGFSASPVAADGRLYLASEDGDVYVVKAGRTYELLATNPMGESLMATPGDQRQHDLHPHADVARRGAISGSAAASEVAHESIASGISRHRCSRSALCRRRRSAGAGRRVAAVPRLRPTCSARRRRRCRRS